MAVDKSIIDYASNRGVDLFYSFDYLTTESIQNLLIESHFTINYPTSNSSHLTNSLSSTFIDSSRYCLPILSTVEPLHSVATKVLVNEDLNRIISYCFDVLTKGDYSREFGLPSLNIAIEKLKGLSLL